jgi:hypothetical protein
MVLGSGIRDPGSRGQKGSGSRILIHYTDSYSTGRKEEKHKLENIWL